ncbi:protein of unknown function [Methylorubrum extorquens]|uniref:Uncharacterized protein n=1 Tax=Methylorubrum extorquens TaxID=408 RepID=A0A2N9AWG8_METEX|nr:protein of unknown function [Methylorubrum extorquens]
MDRKIFPADSIKPKGHLANRPEYPQIYDAGHNI